MVAPTVEPHTSGGAVAGATAARSPRPNDDDARDNGPSNVLMVQNLRDPATPLAGANELRKALGDRARMVTADQGGHGVYLLNKNQCANTAATSFLLTGRLPERDYHCSADATPR